ncbi:TPA: hypothetical protein DF272_01035 [Candidatus Falkowbacteria bacterium]|nr:hypothetical protein [Candidatus Falkowbacteria bacterium]
MLKYALGGVGVIIALLVVSIFLDPNGREALTVFNNLLPLIQMLVISGLTIICVSAVVVSALYDISRQKQRNIRYQMETERLKVCGGERASCGTEEE